MLFARVAEGVGVVVGMVLLQYRDAVDNTAFSPWPDQTRRGAQQYLVGKNLWINHHSHPLLEFRMVAHRHLGGALSHDNFRPRRVNSVVPSVVATKILQIVLRIVEPLERNAGK